MNTSEIELEYEISPPDIKEKMEYLYIDITIQDSSTGNHQGKQTCEFVQDKLKESESLRPVCLMLKGLLKIYDLNQ